MSVAILHLSDSHFSDENSGVLQRPRLIAATMRPLLSASEKVFVIFTGDITNSGEKSEFDLARSFILTLVEEIKKESDLDVEVIVVPGNHDGRFKHSTTTRKGLIQLLRSSNSIQIDDDAIDTCTRPLENYYAFEESLAASGKKFGDKLWKEYRYDFGEKSIRFSAINPSWVSTVPEGEAIFPVDRYSSIVDESASISVLLMHHPLNWYAQSSYHSLREMARSAYQVVMSGHEHTRSTTTVTDSELRSTLFFEAPALEKGPSSAFSVLFLNLDEETISQEVFCWDGALYSPSGNGPTWTESQPIPKRRPKNGLHLTDRMKLQLEALDASFSHPEQEVIKLSDVYVPPDMHDLSSDAEDLETISTSILYQLKDEHARTLIYGDEQFGKSSLLKHLYSEFTSIGLKPLMFDAKDAVGNEDGFRRVVNRLVGEQYGEDAISRYAQVIQSEKVALVDNLDDVGSRGDVIARVLRNIESQFGRVIVSAGERYEVTIMASTEAVKATSEYSTFRMLGFGFKLRHDLIRRWYQIGGMVSEPDYQRRVHAAEQAVNGVLSKGLVPMTAFNTLVLLQTIEVSERGALANAGTAQYYEYMFRHSLTQAKIRAEEIDEIESYLVYLAWEFFSKKSKVISADDFMRFNAWFSDAMHPTNPVHRLDLLLRTKILVDRCGGYAFAYSYLEYFFSAKYLAIHSEQEDVKVLIRKMCRHLYLRENANTVLFLTHHMHSDWVIQEVAGLLSEILSDLCIFRLESDADILNTWVTEKAKLVVDATNVEKNSRDVRESEDKAAKRPDALPDREVSSIRELDQISQLNLLFKTSEILGQVLKGRYGSIPKKFKIDLMAKLFDAPLRGISFFLSFINAAPEAFLLGVSGRLRENLPAISPERADRIAKRYVFNVIGAVADSFLSRQGEIIGSPKLVEVVDSLAADKDNLSYRVVAISSKLSYPGGAHADEIKDLAELMERNYFGYKLLQGVVARHLYMFSLSSAERSRLGSAVGIDVQSQRGIELKSHATKKLPAQGAKPVHAKSLLSRLQESFFLRNKASIESVTSRYAKKGEKDSGE